MRSVQASHGGEIRVLGPLEVLRDGAVVRLAQKERQLLAALLVEAGRTRSSDALIDALWGASPPPSAPKLLQVYVSKLRKLLPASARIETRGAGYALELDDSVIDAARFERLLAEGRETARAGNATLAASLLRRALALWRGSAYGELAYEDFASAEAQRLEELRLACLEERIEAGLELGRHGEALPELLPLADAHPLRERLQGLGMLALYREGRQTEALERYTVTRRLLSEELGLEPGPELRELERRILQHDPSLLSIQTKEQAPSALPTPPNPLLGREPELAELRELLLREDVRLLVLTGAGGSGKTRLAIEVARQCAGDFANGAAFVELAPVQEDVQSAIASALGLEEVGSDLTALAAALQMRELLLVVDNFEHVREEATVLVELVSRIPRLTVLVTSRVVLHLSGEHVYPVNPLREEIALELFLARAREADARFEPNAAAIQAIRTICKRVDGLPLAVELAAGHARTRTPAELLASLEQRLPLLIGGPRDLPARQQTLRATIEWSLALLDESQRGDLARLSVFAGGFTLEAAAAVCETTLERLSVLVDHNLVQRSTHDESSRYSMLETIREYASELLRRRRERTEVFGRHAHYYLGLAERRSSEFEVDGQLSPLLSLEADDANLLESLHYFERAGASEFGLRLCAALWRDWWRRGHLGEGRRRLVAALAAADSGPTVTRVEALRGASTLTLHQADFEAAEVLASEAVALAELVADTLTLSRARVALANAVSSLGDYPRAETLYRESADSFRASGTHRELAVVLLNMADLALHRGDLEMTERLSEESLELCRARSDDAGIAVNLGNLAFAALERDDPLRATALLVDALKRAHRLGYGEWIATMLEGLAAAEAAGGAAERAAELLGASERVQEEIGMSLGTFEQRLHTRTTATISSSMDEQAMAAAWQAGRELQTDDAVAQVLGEQLFMA